MKSWKILSFAILVAVGCGKKKEPESVADGAKAAEVTLGVLDLNRKPIADANDKRAFVAHVQFKNNLANPVTVTKVDWHVDIGEQTLGDNSQAFTEEVAAGATADLTLSSQFTWKDGTEVKADKAHITGTITWTGPKGNANTTAFDLNGTIPEEAKSE